MYHYLLTYIDSFNGGFTNGQIEMTRREPIRTMDDVLNLQAELQQREHLTRCMIMGFSLFSPEGQGR